MRLRGPVFALRAVLLIALAVSPGASLADVTEIWLDKGQVEIALKSGKTVTVDAGHYAKCDDDEDDCEIVPLVLAPSRPEFLQVAGALAPGGVAPGATGVLGTGIPTAAAVGAGAVVIIGGVVAGVISGTGDGTPVTSTTSTTSP